MGCQATGYGSDPQYARVRPVDRSNSLSRFISFSCVPLVAAEQPRRRKLPAAACCPQRLDGFAMVFSLFVVGTPSPPSADGTTLFVAFAVTHRVAPDLCRLCPAAWAQSPVLPLTSALIIPAIGQNTIAIPTNLPLFGKIICVVSISPYAIWGYGRNFRGRPTGFGWQSRTSAGRTRASRPILSATGSSPILIQRRIVVGSTPRRSAASGTVRRWWMVVLMPALYRLAGRLQGDFTISSSDNADWPWRFCSASQMPTYWRSSRRPYKYRDPRGIANTADRGYRRCA